MDDTENELAELTIAELVSQTMVLPLYGSSATTVTDEQAAANRSIYGAATPREVIDDLRPGGVLLLERIPFHPEFGDLPMASVVTAEQLAEYTEQLQAVARAAGIAPLLIVADQEGGRVNRLPVPALPAASLIGATARPDLALRAGALTGRVARSLGVNVVFGPVADVGASNPAIGDRSFGTDPCRVAEMVAATVDGLGAAGVGSVAKHWPGHGRADVDSHESLPTLNIDLAEWQAFEVPPFQAAVDAGVEGVLVAHMSLPAADSTARPASVSRPLVERLRGDVGFSGVVFSDALWMPSIRQQPWTDAETAAAVLAAGVDVLTAPPDPRATIGFISELSAQQDVRPTLEQAVSRSLSLRRRVAAADQSQARGTDWSDEIGELVAAIESAGPAP